MGCASSHLLNPDEDFSQIGSSALSHHIVSLTSTTYGFLSLDPSSSNSKTNVSPNPPPRPTVLSLFPTPISEPRSEPPPEVINSWELMAGLDSTNESFRLYSQPSKRFTQTLIDKENPNHDHQIPNLIKPVGSKTCSLDEFEERTPPKGENKVVIYTTTLRGVRKTFEECNAVRAVMEGHGVFVCERDISMDAGFKEELRDLMKGKEKSELVPPRVFVKGRYIGGADEVLKIMEESGTLGKLLEGLPKSKIGYVCEGCGGVRFLPCFSCNGSCKMVVEWREEGRKRVVVRCGDCNENGLVHCPICS
ncbi:hypothetical protein LXL04_005715 [Taraxacum kok-saghyz]